MEIPPNIKHKEFFTLASDFIVDVTERHARENPESPQLSDVCPDDFIAYIIRQKGNRFNFHNIKRWSKDARKALNHIARFHNNNGSNANTNANCENMMNRSLVPRNAVSGFHNATFIQQPPHPVSEQPYGPVDEQVRHDK